MIKHNYSIQSSQNYEVDLVTTFLSDEETEASSRFVFAQRHTMTKYHGKNLNPDLPDSRTYVPYKQLFIEASKCSRHSAKDEGNMEMSSLGSYGEWSTQPQYRPKKG